MNRRNNARYRANETRMEAAALELMRARDKVNVRTVCERAGVNRSTFYVHFRDVPDMLAKMEATLHGELMESYGGLGTEPLSEESFVPLLEHVREHAYFYGVALERRVDFPIEEGYECLMEAVVRPRCERAGIDDSEEMARMLVFFQAGFTMVLRRWVSRGCRDDVRSVARTLAACVPAAWAADGTRAVGERALAGGPGGVPGGGC